MCDFDPEFKCHNKYYKSISEILSNVVDEVFWGSAGGGPSDWQVNHKERTGTACRAPATAQNKPNLNKPEQTLIPCGISS